MNNIKTVNNANADFFLFLQYCHVTRREIKPKLNPTVFTFPLNVSPIRIPPDIISVPSLKIKYIMAISPAIENGAMMSSPLLRNNPVIAKYNERFSI